MYKLKHTLNMGGQQAMLEHAKSINDDVLRYMDNLAVNGIISRDVVEAALKLGSRRIEPGELINED